MDSLSQQPVNNCSSSGNRQQGSGSALDLFLQRHTENIKKSRTAGNSSSFDNITSGRNANKRSPLCNVDLNSAPGFVLDSAVTGVRRRGRGPSIEILFKHSKSLSASAASRRSPLCSVDQNADSRFVLDSTVTGLGMNSNLNSCGEQQNELECYLRP
ncbi:hypothetical protein DCAR_0416488 [Daucus carota subsp. sativus]|uniref:Uncharacterized protein n=1 Tax=Daucus carota subsp. sativus TaxID=79200 RepID=A0A165XIA4_DAUCS|nr:hypothetical protein DCAR_0416488 [Daucus carota subsp. sativus]